MTRKRSRRRESPSPRLRPDRALLLRSLEVSQRALTAGFLLALPLLIYTRNTEYGYTKSVFAFVTISLLWTLWGLSALLRGRASLRGTPLLWPMVALIGTGALSLWNATSLGTGLQSLGLMVYFFAFYLYLANTVEDGRTLRLHLGAVLLAALGAALYGLLQYYGLLPGTPGVSHGRGAIISSMGNRNYLAGFLSYLFIPGLILLLGRSRGLKLLALGAYALSFAVLWVAHTAGAWLGLAASAAFLMGGLWLYRPMRRVFRRQTAWLAAWLIVLALAAWWMSAVEPLKAWGFSTSASISMQEREEQAPPSLVQRAVDLVKTFWKRNAGRVRAWDWWVGYEMLKDHPLLGVGLGHYKIRFLEYKAKFLQTERGRAYDFHIKRAAQAHNEYVQVAAEMGAAGVLAAAGLLLTVFWSGIRQIRRETEPSERFTRLALLAGVVALLTHALVSFPLHLPASALNGVLLLGLFHSQAFSPSPKPQAREGSLKGWSLRLTVGLVILVGVGVSALAYRDWRADLYLDAGMRDMQRGLYRVAREEFERSLALDFQPSQVLFHLGVVNRLLDEPQRAKAYFERSLKSFVVEELYWHLAVLSLQDEDYETAQRYVDQLLATRPSAELDLEGRYLSAVITMRRGRLQEGIAQLEALAEEDPDFEKTFYSLGEAALIQGDRKGALKYYKKALEIVERKLRKAQKEWQQLRGTQVTASQYSRLRSTIEKLSREREELQRLVDKLSS